MEMTILRFLSNFFVQVFPESPASAFPVGKLRVPWLSDYLLRLILPCSIPIYFLDRIDLTYIGYYKWQAGKLKTYIPLPHEYKNDVRLYYTP